ncbi:MAG: short-chain dehydrogenase [Gloeobacteraceae cyanobacterium ES-bin-316]|jgi:hypothetical protein|nr:short-chain dehydrogenase [Ferruginibacter sp.]
MTNELIEKYVAPRQVGEKEIKIFFKQRSTITGIFIKGADYDELRSKNFWRIVTNANITTWKQTKDVNLAKIFNGMEFTRLSED